VQDDELRRRIRREVVEPLLAELPELPAGDLPPSVLDHRKRRAADFFVDALSLTGSAEVPRPLRTRVRALAHRWHQDGFAGSFEALEAFELELARGPEDDLERHRRWLRKTWGRLELRGLQAAARVFQDLDLVWVPLHLLSPETEVQTLGDAEIRFRPRLPAEEVVERYRRLVLVGGPGSGKSTLVQWLATRKEELRVPFAVPVRSLSGPLDLEQVAALNEADRDFVDACLRDGRALLLLDGLDEGSFLESDPLAELAELAVRFPKSAFLATSRHSGLTAGTLPEGFVQAELQSLDRGEVDTFVDRWCRAAEVTLATEATRPSAERRASVAAEDLKGRLHRSRAVADLARTPLLASVLCIVHRFLGQRIPERRVALYEACTNVLLYEWDRAKFPEGAFTGQLDAPQKKVLLGDLALRMHLKAQTELVEANVAEVFAGRLPDLGLEPEAAGTILSEIRDRSGMLVERRPGVFGFSHLAFQEYLAAVQAVREGRVDLLVEHSREPWWQEVVLLAAGQPAGPAVPLVEALLEQSDDEAAVLAARCVEVAEAVPRKLRRRLEEALGGLVPPVTKEDLERAEQIGPLVGPLLLQGLKDPEPCIRARSAVGIAACGYDLGWTEALALLHDEAEVGEAVVIQPFGAISPPASVGLAVGLAAVSTPELFTGSRRALEAVLRDDAPLTLRAVLHYVLVGPGPLRELNLPPEAVAWWRSLTADPPETPPATPA
jgi:hypothetical protein